MTDPNRPVTGYPAPNPNGNPPPSYASGPPPAYYNNNYQQQPYYNNQQNNNYPGNYAPQRATFLRRILGCLIAAVIISGTILFIVWLILRPTLPEFRVDSLSVSNLNNTASTVSGNFDLRFTVRNPNKKLTVTYEQIRTEILYNRYSLAQNTLPPFTQTTKNETALRAVFSVLDSFVDSDTLDGINKTRGKGGNVWFNVRMLFRVSFKSGAWRNRPRWLGVLCRDLNIGLGANGANGTMIGGPMRCRASF